MGYVAIGLVFIGSVAALVGQLWILVSLFKDSKLLFVLAIVAPPIGLVIFLVFRFEVAWKPVLVVIIGFVIVYAGPSIMPGQLRLEIGL